MVDGAVTTPTANTFPSVAALPSAAQQWARAVMQRVAQLEDKEARNSSKATEQNRTQVQTLRLSAKGILPPTADLNDLLTWNGSEWVAAPPADLGSVPDASTTQRGIVELATDDESGGTSETLAVTPAGLHAVLAGFTGGGGNLADAWRGEWAQP